MQIKKLVFSILIILACLSTTSCSRSKKVENCVLTVGTRSNQQNPYQIVLHNQPTRCQVLNLSSSIEKCYYITYATISRTKIVVYKVYGSIDSGSFHKDYTEKFIITNYSYCYWIKLEE